jgi:hypothetical protein
VAKTSLIITSIAAPNAVMKKYAAECKKRGIDFIVIGDSASPKKFQLDGCRFISLEEQKKLPYKLAKLLPEKHYSRKNLGYLLAKNSDVIIETDDDNFPKKNFWNKSYTNPKVRYVNKNGWVNAYNYFTEKTIWPRGFPLENVLEKNPQPKVSTKKFNTPIIQGLADENPDVDAIYRMTQKLPIRFENKSPLVLGEGSWCPFNSQNTVWKKEAFPLLYLPSYCSFRMTDIWRSLIAQRIAWTCGWNVLFHSADVWQERNEHNLVKDFEEEVPGYINNDQIRKSLEDLDLKSGIKNIGENMIRSYAELVNKSYISKSESQLINSWVDSISLK